jgi:hypothetical protein
MGGSDERTSGEFGGDEPTVPDSGSVLSEALRDVGVSLNEIVRDCAESARLIPRLQGDARVVAVREFAKKMGSLGDVAHETRQSLESLAADAFLLSRL